MRKDIKQHNRKGSKNRCGYCGRNTGVQKRGDGKFRCQSCHSAGN